MPMDRSAYPENWEEISQYVRFERAGGRCEFCGAEHGQPHPETGSTVVLTTAHLDHDTTNNNAPGNLRALCQRCHLKHDQKLHLEHAAQTRRQREIDAGQLSLW
jgi:hypothetical protein